MDCGCMAIVCDEYLRTGGACPKNKEREGGEIMLLRQLFAVLQREDGQDLAEYGLVIALIAVIAIAALTTLGGSISTILASIAGAI